MPIEIDIKYIRIKQKEIIKNLSFKLNEGEVLGITGINGSGKSLLLGVIAGFFPCKYFEIEGHIKVDDFRINFNSYSEHYDLIFSKIHLLFQDPVSTFDSQKKLEYYFRSFPEIKYRNYFDELNLGPPEFLLKKYPHEISFGMAQRLWLILALTGGYKYLLLDEAFDSLDLPTKNLFLDKILTSKMDGKGIIFVSHDEEIVEKYADKILRLS